MSELWRDFGGIPYAALFLLFFHLISFPPLSRGETRSLENSRIFNFLEDPKGNSKIERNLSTVTRRFARAGFEKKRKKEKKSLETWMKNGRNDLARSHWEAGNDEDDNGIIDR